MSATSKPTATKASELSVTDTQSSTLAKSMAAKAASSFMRAASQVWQKPVASEPREN